ncbi:MAG: transcriptional regulator [Cytophagaceae bacterium]|nr:transcriptional regulator [Gemmatimonadaceae bacterium]
MARRSWPAEPCRRRSCRSWVPHSCSWVPWPWGPPSSSPPRGPRPAARRCSTPSWPGGSAGSTCSLAARSRGSTVARRSGSARATKPVSADAVERPATADATAAELDRLIHERVRLGIVSALAVNESLSFNDLKALMGTTDGNLSVHARKLEDAGYVSCKKTFEGRVPKTHYALTSVGRRALERYLEHMEAIIKVTREGRQ